MSTYWSDRFHLGTGPIPVSTVIQPEYFELEREKLFRRVWLNVGRVEDAAKPGDYFVKYIDVLHTSLLIVCGADGVVRSFHNVCTHRGNRVANACSGSAKAFACNFHGWTFDLAGKLVHVPDEGEFPGFQKAKLGLIPVATEIWQGFIFVNVDPQPKESLATYLGEMARDLDGYPFDSMKLLVKYSAEVKTNWKLFLDAFQEGYHVPFVHKTSIPKGFLDQAVTHLTHLDSVRCYKRHRSLSAGGNPMFEPTPAEAEILKHSVTCSLGHALPQEKQPKGTNPDRIASWSFDLNIIFPIFFVDVSAGWYLTYNFWPLAVDRTLWEISIYTPKAQTVADHVAYEYVKILLRDAVREDGTRLEAIQEELSSGVLREFVLSDQEVLVRHNYNVVDQYVRS